MADSVKRVLIVGGVAGGMTAAVRLRRLREDIEIHLFERGPDISIASCGIPYFISGEITDRKKMAIVTPKWAKDRYNVNVHTMQEVVGINRARNEITVRDVTSGETKEHTYDRLILSPGAAPITGGISGVNLPGVYTLRTLEDMDEVFAAIGKLEVEAAAAAAATTTGGEEAKKNKKRAIVIGASFIGLEVTEALVKRGMETTVLELANQVLPAFDGEMCVPLKAVMENKGVKVMCGTKPICIEATGKESKIVRCEGGKEYEAEIIFVCIGVAPETKLAKEAGGIEMGVNGSIVVDEYMRTTDPKIYACGDAVQSKNTVLGTTMVLALAGPAARQARVAAAHIAGHGEGKEKFGGVIGTAVVRVFEIIAGCVGASEKAMKKAGMKEEEEIGKLYLFSPNKVEWYPTSVYLLMKVMFSKKTEKVMGAQIIGREGVEKRIDALAVAIQAGMTVRQLAQVELAYAPQFNGPKDPLNIAGFVASNQLDGLSELCFPDTIPMGAVILDVREEPELKMQGEFPPGSLFIPFSVLRSRISDIPKDKTIVVACKVGQRGNAVMRILKQNGFHAMNLSGGIMVFNLFHNKDLWRRYLQIGLL